MFDIDISFILRASFRAKYRRTLEVLVQAAPEWHIDNSMPHLLYYLLCVSDMEVEHEGLRLQQSTLHLLAQTEDATGRRVFLRADCDNPPFRARVTLPSTAAENSVQIFYDPMEVDHLDHLVGHECGHLLRGLGEVPPIIPVIDATNQYLAAGQLFADEDRFTRLDAMQLEQWMRAAVSAVFNGPADIQIERWLWDQFPARRRSQLKSLQRLADITAGWLAPPSREQFMRPWYATNAMCAAVLSCLPSAGIHSPYAGTAFASAGLDLADIVIRSGARDGSEDRHNSNLWAADLGIARWFDWDVSGEPLE